MTFRRRKCPKCGKRGAKKIERNVYDPEQIIFRIYCKKCRMLVIRAWVLFPSRIISSIEEE